MEYIVFYIFLKVYHVDPRVILQLNVSSESNICSVRNVSRH